MLYHDCDISINSSGIYSIEKRKLLCIASNITYNCDADFSMYGNATYTYINCDNTYRYLRENIDYKCNCTDLKNDDNITIFIALGSCVALIFIIIALIQLRRQYKLSGSVIRFLDRN